jgi:hypothetical protein
MTKSTTAKATAASPKPESQSEKFKAAARALECDEDEARWDERLRKVAQSGGAGNLKRKVPE